MRPRYKVPENAKASPSRPVGVKAARRSPFGQLPVFGARADAIEAQEAKDETKGREWARAMAEGVNAPGPFAEQDEADWESLLEESDYVAVMGAISRRGLPIVQLWLKEYATTKKEPTK